MILNYPHLVSLLYAIFTWVNDVAFITLVPKINAATIQAQPPLDTREAKLTYG